MQLNADLGEKEHLEDFRKDLQLIALIDMANVSCLAHAGTIEVLEETLYACTKYGVKIGAHPSYADRANFGRESMKLSETAFQEVLNEQLHFFMSRLKDHGLKLYHIKPHGALYHDLMYNDSLAEIFVECLNEFSSHYSTHFEEKRLRLLGLPGSFLEKRCQNSAIHYMNEAFADRRYEQDGSLQSRKIKGSVLTISQAEKQLECILENTGLETAQGSLYHANFDSICVHGDSPDALTIVKVARALIDQNKLKNHD